jgi:uncharacterized RDD family membrane protein YckC
VGILHRDIKPSNCFIETDGCVKIGDFGLSVSSLARADSLLTTQGGFLGTPAFSSPEQLRGETVDVRSDIYSVGATLYYLLTGRAPFEGENLVALLATVLEKKAPSARSFRSEIPQSLSVVLERCVAKPAGDRFANYAELRRALLPFASKALMPATLGLRFAAQCVDEAVVFVSGMLFHGMIALLFASPGKSHGWSAAAWMLTLAYYATAEGRWGATLGKRIAGLRVVNAAGGEPGVGRAMLRALFFHTPAFLFTFFLALTAGFLDSEQPYPRFLNAISSLCYFAYVGSLSLSARRDNGHATALDLWTGTRVIQSEVDEPAGSTVADHAPATASTSEHKIGPFHVLGFLGGDESSEFWLGYDEKLTRKVWMRKVLSGSRVSDRPQGLRARPGQLRWLQSWTQNDAAWDVYEAPPGMPVVHLLSEPKAWNTVRHWVLALAEELEASRADASGAQVLSLDRLWITEKGRIKLLEFRAPAVTPVCEDIPAAEAAVFLNQLAISALEGRIAPVEEARIRTPKAPLPLSARAFFNELPKTSARGEALTQLRTIVRQRSKISPRRRVALVLGCSIHLIVLGIGSFGLPKESEQENVAAWLKSTPNPFELKAALELHNALRDGVDVTCRRENGRMRTVTENPPGLLGDFEIKTPFPWFRPREQTSNHVIARFHAEDPTLQTQPGNNFKLHQINSIHNRNELLEDLEVYISERFGRLLDNGDVWASFSFPPQGQSSHSWKVSLFGKDVLTSSSLPFPAFPEDLRESILPKAEIQRAQEIRTRYRSRSVADLTAARTRLSQTFQATPTGSNGSSLLDDLEHRSLMPSGIKHALRFMPVAILAVLSALVARGGLLLRILGMAVVRMDGSDASRWRIFWRACVAWFWVPFLCAEMLVLQYSDASQLVAVCLMGLAVIPCVIWSIISGRGLQDLASGTCLVPR